MADRDLGVKKRLEAFIHLTGYMVHPLMFTSFILACLATLFRVDSFRIADIFSQLQGGFNSETLRATATRAPQYLIWGLIGLLILLCTVAAWIPPVVALKGQPLPLSRKLSSVLILFLLGCGISLSNTIEAVKALLTNRNWAFKRTPKYAIQHEKDEWRDKRYQVSLDFVCFLELVLVCLGVSAIAYAVWRLNFGVLLILVPFTAAYAFVSTLTILQSRREGGA
jgi:predicted ferric reductase